MGEPSLRMRDLVRERTRKNGPATWFKGSSQVDGAFATPDLDCCAARFLPFWMRMGDHRAIAIDIPHQLLVGEQLLKVVCPEA